MSKVISLHHIVFATKWRQTTIPSTHKKELYQYIYGILKKKNYFLHRMNGMSDHIHMLIDLHPSISLSYLMQQVKQWSSHWLKNHPSFPNFAGWGEGYYAISLGMDSLDACKDYIINQEIHHSHLMFMDEMEQIAGANGLEWYPDDWAN